MKKVILITGATDGISRQAAIMLAQQGHTVYGDGRNPQKLETLKKENVIPVKLDLTQRITLEDAIQMILDKEGQIDVLINCAGYGSDGAIENVTIKEAKRQFDVNLFGLAELVKLVLPQMRKQHSGRIVNISSMGGRLTIYFGAWYHALSMRWKHLVMLFEWKQSNLESMFRLLNLVESKPTGELLQLIICISRLKERYTNKKLIGLPR